MSTRGIAATSGTATPQATSLSAILRDVLNYVQMPTDPDAKQIAASAVNEGIDTLNQYEWYWTRVYQDITLQQQIRDYELSADFKLHITTELLGLDGLPGFDILHHYPHEMFRDTFRDVGTEGSPCAYTIVNPYGYNRIQLDVAPDLGFVEKYPYLRLWYHRHLPHLIYDQDSLGALAAGALAFVKYSARAACAQIWDPAKVRLAQGSAATFWAGLRRDHRQFEAANQR